MPSRRVVEDSDEEDNIDNSPVRQPKPTPAGSPVPTLNESGIASQSNRRVSAGQSTGSTEVLSREIQDAYNHLLEPSTGRSSRSSYPSSDSKRRAAINFEADGVKKSMITYGAKKSQRDCHLVESYDNDGPVKAKRRARSSMAVDGNEGKGEAEDQMTGSSSINGTSRDDDGTPTSPSDPRGQCHDYMAPDASMPPPVSRIFSFKPPIQSSGGSTIPFPDPASSPPTADGGITSLPAGGYEDIQSPHPGVENLEKSTLSKSRTRKRAVSELESPKIILGEEIPPSSSAPAESSTKRAHIDPGSRRGTSPRSWRGSDGCHDELSLPVAGSPNSKNKQNKIRKSETKTLSAATDQPDGLGSDDFNVDLPKENYQPRPSRSRSTLTADELVIPEDFSKRPEALAKSKAKAKSKRRKTTAFEESSHALEPIFIHPDAVLEVHPDEATASATAAARQPSPQLSPPRKKSRGRPKKEAATLGKASDPAAEEIPQGDNTNIINSSIPIEQADPAPAPAKRGRKRNKTTVGGTNIAQGKQPQGKPALDTQDPEPPTKSVLAESDSNIQPNIQHKENTSETAQATLMADSPMPNPSDEALTKLPNDENPSPRVEQKMEPPKHSSSPPKQESKTIYRVGLSKRQRIPSLLRVVRK